LLQSFFHTWFGMACPILPFPFYPPSLSLLLLLLSSIGPISVPGRHVAMFHPPSVIPLLLHDLAGNQQCIGRFSAPHPLPDCLRDLSPFWARTTCPPEVCLELGSLRRTPFHYLFFPFFLRLKTRSPRRCRSLGEVPKLSFFPSRFHLHATVVYIPPLFDSLSRRDTLSPQYFREERHLRAGCAATRDPRAYFT